LCNRGNKSRLEEPRGIGHDLNAGSSDDGSSADDSQKKSLCGGCETARSGWWPVLSIIVILGLQAFNATKNTFSE
jgi:hypothetical protein